MPSDFDLTRCENFSLARSSASKMAAIDASAKYPLCGKVGARAMGPVTGALASVVDALVHTLLAVLKAPVALLLAPYNFIAMCFIPGKTLPKDLEISSVFVHLFRVVESVFFAATVPIITVFDPQKAHALVTWKEGNTVKEEELKKSEEDVKKKELEIQKKDAEILKLENEIKLAREKILKNKQKKLELKETIEKLRAPKEIKEKISINDLKPEWIDFVHDEVGYGENDIEDYLSKVPADDLEIWKNPPVENYDDLMKYMDGLDQSLVNTSDDYIIDYKNLKRKLAEIDNEEATNQQTVIIVNGQQYTEEEYNRLFPESEMSVDSASEEPEEEAPVQKPFVDQSKAEEFFMNNLRPTMSEPSKLDMTKGFEAVKQTFTQKIEHADQLVKLKKSPSHFELTPKAMQLAKNKITENRKNTEVETKQKVEDFVKDQEEKKQIIKPQFDSILSQIKTGAQNLRKVEIEKKAEEKTDVIDTKLSVKERANFLNAIIKAKKSESSDEEMPDRTSIDATSSDDSIEEKRYFIDGVEYDEDEYNLIGGENFISAPQEPIVEAETTEKKEPRQLVQEANNIFKSMMKTKLWKTDRPFLEKSLQNLYEKLSFVVHFNNDWKQITAVPSPYGEAEKELLKLILVCELDHDSAACGFNPADCSGIATIPSNYEEVVSKLGAYHDSLNESLLPELEQAVNCYVQIRLQKEIIAKNPDGWDTGCNKAYFHKAYANLVQIQRVQLQVSEKNENLTWRFDNLIKGAEKQIEEMEGFAPQEMEHLPLAFVEEPKAYSFPLTSKINAIKEQKPQTIEELSGLMRQLKTLNGLWKNHGVDLEDAIEALASDVKKKDKADYLSRYDGAKETLTQAVKDLSCIRSEMLEYWYHTQDALDIEMLAKRNRAEDALDRIRNAVAADDIEGSLLDEIYQEANYYMTMGYSADMLTSLDTIDQIMQDLKKECEDIDTNPVKGTKEYLLNLLERTIAFKAQWDYENKMLQVG